MSKLRLYELAKELEKTSKEVLSMLKDKGIEVASHSSTLSEEQIEVVRKAAAPKKEAPAKEEPEKKAPIKEEAGAEKEKDRTGVPPSKWSEAGSGPDTARRSPSSGTAGAF